MTAPAKSVAWDPASYRAELARLTEKALIRRELVVEVVRGNEVPVDEALAHRVPCLLGYCRDMAHTDLRRKDARGVFLAKHPIETLPFRVVAVKADGAEFLMGSLGVFKLVPGPGILCLDCHPTGALFLAPVEKLLLAVLQDGRVMDAEEIASVIAARRAVIARVIAR